ncbi:MAG TPA: acyloxyacyl hydrolase [Candidatus Udaeobacter sp.]|jgi:opacity protein-like surface antigen|nr:acyloxyacyl hydrolase [Candidatus Udaeobacter sp.]
MKALRICVACVALSICSHSLAGGERQSVVSAVEEFNPHRFELALETGYLFGAINPPTDYQIGAVFLTGRIRWGIIRSDSWLRGYNQFYVSGMAEPIFKGIENHYFGFNLGMRYNFVQPGSRFVPYFSGGVGAGGIDSHPEVPGGQGQDFTFNILTAAGVSYIVNDHWKIDVGVLYQHLSNGGQTDPNPSLNLFGPQVGVTSSF